MIIDGIEIAEDNPTPQADYVEDIIDNLVLMLNESGIPAIRRNFSEDILSLKDFISSIIPLYEEIDSSPRYSDLAAVWQLVHHKIQHHETTTTLREMIESTVPQSFIYELAGRISNRKFVAGGDSKDIESLLHKYINNKNAHIIAVLLCQELSFLGYFEKVQEQE